MLRTLALLIVLGVAFAVRRTIGAAAADGGTVLAFGFALLAAALAGDLADRVRLPRVTGYLLFGFATGPSLANLISGPMARELRLIDGIAVALIAMMAGLEMNLARLWPRLRPMLQAGGITILVLYTSLFVVFYVAWPWLPILPDAAGAMRASMAALLAAIVTSFSPTVTIAVIAENRAEGPLTELTLAVVVLGDLALVLAFGLAMQFVRSATGASDEDVGLFAHLTWDVIGSIAFGAIVGAALAAYLRIVGREIGIAVVIVCIVLSEVGGRLHFEHVLSALSAGLVVENVAPPRGDALRLAVERSALPILIVFFAAAGASLRVDALREVGMIAVAVSILRLLLIRAGTALGSSVAGITGLRRRLLWRGLVSQAGLTLGLTVIVASEYPDWGLAVQTLMVAMIALHELAGPILFRTALAEAGEIGTAPEFAAGPTVSAG